MKAGTTAIALLFLACADKPQEHFVPLGIDIDHYGALPCKLETAEPKSAVEAEVTQAYLVGEAKGIDRTTVRLRASKPAVAKVACNGSEHQIHFVAAKKLKLEKSEASAAKVGNEVSFVLRAFDASDRQLLLDGIGSSDIDWKIEGPAESAPRSHHDPLPSRTNAKSVAIVGKGPVVVTAKWGELSASAEVNVL
jgi:hypothetical protein